MWVLPTYRRPGICQRALDSIIAVGCATPGIVLVDGDADPAYDRLRLPENWCLYRRERNEGMLASLNHVFALYPDRPWYGLLNDDVIVHTPGWDTALVQAAGPRGLSSCDDGWRGGSHICGAAVFGGDFLRALGWWSPKGLWHCYADNIWEIIGRDLGCWKYVPTVLVEHRHHLNGKAANDATYKNGYEKFAQDHRVFQDFCRDELAAAVVRVKSLFKVEIERSERKIEYARTRKLMIATPMARDPRWQYAVSLYSTGLELQRMGIVHCVQYVLGSSNLPRARNELAARFLASDCTDLLFIDDDMGWDAESVVRILASPQDFIGAVGRKRVDKPLTALDSWCVEFMHGADTHVVSDGEGAIEVARVGCGFLKLTRVVFEKLIAANPDWRRPGRSTMPQAVRDNYYRFFAFADDSETGEDYVLCDRWRGEGGRIWVDPSIALSHVGEKEYSGALDDVMISEDASVAAQNHEMRRVA